MLKDMIAAEYEARRDVYRFEGNVLSILETRCRERSDFRLIVDSLDWDRNAKSRRILQGEKDKKQAFKKREKAKQVDYALPYLEAATRPFTLDTAKSIRSKIVSDFRHHTKYQFIKARNVLMKKQFTLASIMDSLVNETVMKEVEQKQKMVLLCSSIKNQLDMLLLKMERFKEKRIERYNNLALYLNNIPEFKKLPPLKLYVRDIFEN
ncbi:dynein regulatory complex subunit 7-like [Adelges cooleyi]|uniref:dynein regulatory complex subunit 7-like n=1 Tax=Adelges cooleyi TaxID=133065 RepID=UPI00218069FC|nr:dynein regulatory complex subunit 7-like [Adelges cooleyi]